MPLEKFLGRGRVGIRMLLGGWMGGLRGWVVGEDTRGCEGVRFDAERDECANCIPIVFCYKDTRAEEMVVKYLHVFVILFSIPLLSFYNRRRNRYLYFLVKYFSATDVKVPGNVR